MWTGRRPGDRRAAVPALRLHVPPGRRRRPRRRRWPRVRGRRRRAPTSAAAPRPVPEPRRLVPGPGRRDRAAARRALDPRTCRPCWSTTSRWSGSPPGAALPGVRAVVRHRADRRLARALPRRRGGLRPPAHPADHLARRRALRGGVAGLPARVAPARRPARAAAHPARRRAVGRSHSAGTPRRRGAARCWPGRPAPARQARPASPASPSSPLWTVRPTRRISRCRGPALLYASHEARGAERVRARSRRRRGALDRLAAQRRHAALPPVGAPTARSGRT